MSGPADDPLLLTLATEPWGIRVAVISETDGVDVIYEREHATGVVNLLPVGRQSRKTGSSTSAG
jgi:hypothetical protein